MTVNIIYKDYDKNLITDEMIAKVVSIGWCRGFSQTVIPYTDDLLIEARQSMQEARVKEIDNIEVSTIDEYIALCFSQSINEKYHVYERNKISDTDKLVSRLNNDDIRRLAEALLQLADQMEQK